MISNKLNAKNDEFLQHSVVKLPWSSLTTIMDQVKGKEQRECILWNLFKSVK